VGPSHRPACSAGAFEASDVAAAAGPVVQRGDAASGYVSREQAQLIASSNQ